MNNEVLVELRTLEIHLRQYWRRNHIRDVTLAEVQKLHICQGYPKFVRDCYIVTHCVVERLCELITWYDKTLNDGFVSVLN